jgi:hypothetical protein
MHRRRADGAVVRLVVTVDEQPPEVLARAGDLGTVVERRAVGGCDRVGGRPGPAAGEVKLEDVGVLVAGADVERRRPAKPDEDVARRAQAGARHTVEIDEE